MPVVARPPGALAVYRVELVKLRAQRRWGAAMAVCFLGPIGAGLLLRALGSLPKDTLFGRHLLESADALPLVVLGFAATWGLPLLASLVAGEIFAGEDGGGTWGALLTRSVSRSSVFNGKILAAMGSAIGLVVAAACGSIVGGYLLAGTTGRPLVGLDGEAVPPAHALPLVLASWASVLPPVLAFCGLACLLSVAVRSSVAGVGVPVLVGLVMTMLSLLDGLGGVRDLLPTTAMFAWHGFWVLDPYLDAWVQGALVSLAYTAVCLALARRILLRRDEAGR